MDAKINQQKYGKKKDIYIVSKYIPTKYLLRTEGKITIGWRKLRQLYSSDKVNITTNEINQHHVSSDMMH